MVNNSTSINKTNNYLRPKIIEHKKKTGAHAEILLPTYVPTIIKKFQVNELQ